MTVTAPHTYTEPPLRITTELNELNQDLFTRVEALLGDFPEIGEIRTNHDGELERLGDTVVTHRFVDAPSDSETVRWHLVEAGDPSAPTVAFLHGVPDSWWQWHYAIESLASQYHCLAIDLKGYGQSDKRTGDYRQAGVASQLLSLLDTLGVDEFALGTCTPKSRCSPHPTSQACSPTLADSSAPPTRG
jgi:hypothetical protein